MTLDHLTLDIRSTSLVLVDIQERLLAAMPESVQETLVTNATILTKGMRALDVPVVVTEQYPKGLGPTVPALSEALGLPAGGVAGRVEKVEFDCTQASSFALPADRKTAVLAGMEAHICVWQTAVGLLRQGFTVWVAEDAIASRKKANWRSAVRMLTEAGAVVAPTEAILFGLLKKAGGDAFKTISRLVR